MNAMKLIKICIRKSLIVASMCFAIVSPCKSQDTSTILKPNDIIRIEIYNEPKISIGQTIVSKGGEVTLHLLGQVNIAKLTLDEAADKLQKLYQVDYLVNPKVTITILKQADEIVAILGSVKAAGQLVIPQAGMDLSTALATAGGLMETADPNRIELTRASGQSAVYNYSDVSNGAAGKVKLMNGDRILVGQSPFVGKTVTVGGQVTKRGLIPYPLDGKLDLVSAIAFSGGLTELANGKIMLTRKGKTSIINFNDIIEKGAENIPLLPGDNIQADIRRI
jgi:polysaccharide biosynthesis/export protein